MPFRAQFSSLFAQDATIAAVVFALVFAALLAAVALSWWRRRRRKGPSRRSEVNKLEIGYVLALAGMVAFLVISSFTANASADVVHAFWVPYLRFKVYAYPGHTNAFTVTLPHTGRRIGRCAQLCGLYYYGMDFYLQAVSPASFGQFMRSSGGTALAGAS